MNFPYSRYFFCNFSRGYPVFSPCVRKIPAEVSQKLLATAMTVQNSQRSILHDGFAYQIAFNREGGLAEVAARSENPMLDGRIPAGAHLARFSLNVLPNHNADFFTTLANDYLNYGLADPNHQTESLPEYFVELTRPEGRVPLVLGYSTTLGTRLTTADYSRMTKGVKDVLTTVMPSLLNGHLTRKK